MSAVLSPRTTQRVFNPADKKDLLELKFFKANNKWKTACPFKLVFPYLGVPNMCESMYTEYMMEKLA